MTTSESLSTAAIPELIELTEIQNHQGKDAPLLRVGISAIEHVTVRLAVQVGETTITIGELNSMKEEHVIKLNNLADAPVDILLEGKLVARGQLVAVDDNFGVRVTELPKAQA